VLLPRAAAQGGRDGEPEGRLSRAVQGGPVRGAQGGDDQGRGAEGVGEGQVGDVGG